MMAFEGNSPRRPLSGAPGSVSSRSWTEWTQQLQAYVAWVNSQLRKKPGTKEVKDLRRELQDGTVLVELIEIVANETIPGAHYKPTNSLEMKENIERVLQFMRSRKIKMHQIRSTDVVEGNMKSIMRLILALAAHFKPSSVKQSSTQASKSSRSLGIAQEAASALASIRKDAESIKRKMHRPANLKSSDVDRGTEAKPPINRKLGYDSGLAEGHPPLDVMSSPKSSLRSVSSKSSLDSGSEGDVVDRYSSLLEDVQESQVVLIDDTKMAHGLLIELQNVLLNGDNQLDETLEISENSTNHEQLVIYQARMQQTEESCSRLKEELSRTKQECMQLQGMKQGLHQRLSEQQQEILEMKARKLRADIEENDGEEAERLRDELTEKTTMLNRMHTELERREKTIQHLESELKAQSSHGGEIIKSLEAQVKELETSLSETEERLKSLDSEVKPPSSLTQRSTAKLNSADSPADSEIGLAESALQALRQSHPEHNQHLESLETAFVTMVTRLKEVSKQQAKPTAEVKGHRVFNRVTGSSKADTTKLLCFSNKSVTPSMKSIKKNLGEITLKDYKSIFTPSQENGGGSSVRLKYLFKALDPEFGTVKEELTDDNDVIPGWEGKVIGWVEEELA